MLSHKYAPTKLSEIVGQGSVIQELEAFVRENAALGPYGLYLLLESAGAVGCGKTSAARIIARDITEDGLVVDWRDDECTPATILHPYHDYNRAGIWGNHRQAVIIDDIDCLSLECLRALRAVLDWKHYYTVFIATTATLTWADKVPGLLSRWRRFRFVRPTLDDTIATLRQVIAKEGMELPRGFRLKAYLLGEYGPEPEAGNIRDALNQLPGALHHYRKQGRKEV